jgi:hypothetical protein
LVKVVELRVKELEVKAEVLAKEEKRKNLFYVRIMSELHQ